MKSLKLFALLFIIFFSLPTLAQAADIPLLTWERGRTQQVVLGGGAYINDWQVKLEGNGIDPLLFTASQANGAGYVIYSLEFPKDLPVGAYMVSTEGSGSPRTVVAGIEVIEAQTYTVADSLFDLTIIIAIFVFITAVISALRSAKYSQIAFSSSQVRPNENSILFGEKERFSDRLAQAPYRVRISGMNSLRDSLFRFLLIREGELAHRISKDLYGALPIVGFIAGGVAAVETIRNKGIATTPLTIFIAIAAIAIFDAYSGLLATLGFWAVQAITGNITSFRDILIMFAVGFAWVAPSLFAGVLRDTINRDFKPSTDLSRDPVKPDPVKFVGVLASALIGSVLFYFGHALVNSAIYTQSPVRNISIVAVGVVSLMLVVRGFLESVHFEETGNKIVRDESFFIARVSSPRTALILSAIVFSFVYIWTTSAGKSAVVSIIFTLPYYLIFVGFNQPRRFNFKAPKRNVLIESLITVGATFIIFRQISIRPLLGDQRADLMLLVAGIPGVVHAIYSAICSSTEKREIIQS